MKLVGDEVPVPEDADIVSRFLGLVSRDPSCPARRRPSAWPVLGALAGCDEQCRA